MKPRFYGRGAAGFSLVELMVSIVIGLLAVLFATRMMTDSERSKDGALGGSDSMQDGMMAMFSISADAEQAGFGLNDPILAGCDTAFSDDGGAGYALATVKRGTTDVEPLAAAVIVNGGARPDTVSFYSGSAAGGTISVRLVGNYNGGSQIMIDRDPYGFAEGDVFVVAPEDGVGRCALAQVSALTEGASPAISFNDTSDRYNTGELGRTFPGSATRVFNLGPAAGLSFHTWLVENGVLRLRATNLGQGDDTQAVADNIVSIKAQYGLDTRAGAAFDPEQGMQIGAWSNEMTDADGDGVTGGPGDYQRVAAIRLAVVARNRSPERPAAGGACSVTTEPLTVFGSRQPSEVDAVPVELDLSDTGDGPDWTCYRYRAFETIVPLRNSGWRPTA